MGKVKQRSTKKMKKVSLFDVLRPFVWEWKIEALKRNIRFFKSGFPLTDDVINNMKKYISDIDEEAAKSIPKDLKVRNSFKFHFSLFKVDFCSTFYIDEPYISINYSDLYMYMLNGIFNFNVFILNC